MTIDLEARIRRLEDRALISECVIRSVVAVDRRDWDMYASCFTDPVYVDFSTIGLPARDFVRGDLVALVREGINRLAATQHLSTNHLIELDDGDPDRAICHGNN